MKKFRILLFFLTACHCVNAQKKLVDTAAYDNWPGIDFFTISNDGAFYAYYGDAGSGIHQLTVKATNGSWQKTLPANGWAGQFTADSKQLIYLSGKDSLCIQALGGDKRETISKVASFKLGQSENNKWLLYQLTAPGNSLVVRDLSNGTEQNFSGVTDYQVVPRGRSFLLFQQSADSSMHLSLFEPVKGTITGVWQGKNPNQVKYSTDGRALAFIGNSIIDGRRAIWYYKGGDENARSLAIENYGLIQGYTISTLTGFNATGDNLLFTLQAIKTIQKPNPALSSVDVYNHKDPKLQSMQLAQVGDNPDYTWSYNLSGGRLFPIERVNEQLISPLTDKFALVKRDSSGDVDYEWWWNKQATCAIDLVSNVNGSLRNICPQTTVPLARLYQLSPSGKYILHYDPAKRGYLCENMATGKRTIITKGANILWEEPQSTLGNDYTTVIGWTWDDSSVLIAAQYDIYQVDPEGRYAPISLTNGIGGKRHLSFDNAFISKSDTVVDITQPVILHYINHNTEEEGFYRVFSESKRKPELLSVFPKKYDPGRTIKLSGDAGYVVALQDESHPNNYYLTADFRTFKPLTYAQPSRTYNWLTAKLVKWKTPGGNIDQGIFYKPENFDPKKKYPVIFFYYEKMTDLLHKYYSPGFSGGGEINIPTYVSNGYLVFLPDIHYKIGHPGKSACQTIVSAAEYLSKYPWVDQQHMGLMGHSWGSFETNYVITHSHLFAAAVSMSGQTDFVSGYGELCSNGQSRQQRYEVGQSRIGATLWQRPDLYLENSPVLQADKVTTPILLMANKRDGIVPYEQGFEFFMALRRLSKKAWMLQYDDGEHNVFGIDAKDNTIRIRQFFDYYLKGLPPPKWMVSGVPATLKQIDSGLERDTTGGMP